MQGEVHWQSRKVACLGPIATPVQQWDPDRQPYCDRRLSGSLHICHLIVRCQCSEQQHYQCVTAEKKRKCAYMCFPRQSLSRHSTSNRSSAMASHLCAGEALKANITTLGPLVLPISEQLLFAGNMLARKFLGKKRLRPYIPDFKLAFEHVCIHTGGRGVIDEIEKQLSLTQDYADPSRATLYRFGNISSSSIW